MKRLTPIFKTESIYLFLLPVFFVLHGYVENYPALPQSDAFKLLIVYEGVALVFFVVNYLILSNSSRAAAFTFVLLCIQFFFGAFQDTVKSIFGTGFIARYSALLPLLLCIAIAAFLFIKNTRFKIPKLSTYLILLLTLLIFIDTVSLVVKQFDRQTASNVANRTPCAECTTPNIYLIILDEYAGRKQLHDQFNFNNEAFENALNERGFLTLKNSRSNYNYTPFSMASTLSMDYLNGISTKSNDIRNRNICYETINENNLVRTLTQFKYRFFNLSLFDFAGQPTDVSNNTFYSTRGKIITDQTLTGRVSKDLAYHLVTTFEFDWALQKYKADALARIRNTYQGTVDIAKQRTDSPKFVYTHFIMPHYPYLLDKDGNELSFALAVQGGRKDLYLGYLQYSNKLSLSLIDAIRTNDKSDPIIILMSDHGFTKYPDTSNQNYNFYNMINIYMPNKNDSLFTDSITNVNVFRTLLNTQFHQNLPLLKDSTVFLKEY